MSDGEVRDYRSLGEILRQAREKRNWTLEQLSERTRISPRMLQALEHDDLEQVSGPVYARSFIKSIAREFDLDAEWLLSKVDLDDPSSKIAEAVKAVSAPVAPVPKVAPTAPAPAERGPVWQVESVRVRKVEPVRTAPEIPWRAVGAGLAVLVLVAVAWIVWSAIAPSSSTQPSATPMATESSRREPPATAEPTEDEGAVDATESAATGKDAVDEPVARTPEERAAPAKDPEEIVKENAASEAGGLPSIVRPDPAQGKPMELVLRAVSRVEITVVVDGQPARQSVLNAGQTWQLTGFDHFEVRASDPGALRAELDSVPKSPPAGWNGTGWMIFPDDAGRGAN